MNVRKYKKILLSAVCLVLVLLLSACTAQQPLVSDETATTTKETEQSTTTEQTVATTTEAEMAVKTTQKTTVRKTTVKKVVTTTEKVKMSPLEAIPVAGSEYAGPNAYQYPFWSYDALGSHEDLSVPKTVTVSFEGKMYTGQYFMSFLERYKNYQRDTYTFEGGSFCVNTQTGELVQIAFSEKSGGNKSKTQCQKIAFELADKYIDRNACTLDTTMSENEYTFDFQKKLEGIPTEETMRICVGTDGKINSFRHAVAGQFPTKKSAYSKLNQQKIRALNTDKAEALALKKTEQLLPSYNKRVLNQKKWVMLEDGEIGMIFVFELTYQNKSPAEGEPRGSSLLDILVK